MLNMIFIVQKKLGSSAFIGVQLLLQGRKEIVNINRITNHVLNPLNFSPSLSISDGFNILTQMNWCYFNIYYLEGSLVKQKERRMGRKPPGLDSCLCSGAIFSPTKSRSQCLTSKMRVVRSPHPSSNMRSLVESFLLKDLSLSLAPSLFFYQSINSFIFFLPSPREALYFEKTHYF